MGLVRMGIPHEIVSQLRQNYEITHFIETGTYLGHTAAWAAEHFEKVTTIELSHPIYESTREQYKHLTAIDFHFGDSREVLQDIAPSLDMPALFWLDGHWSGGETYGAEDQCPLIEEIQAINASPIPHFIFIDDARLFTSTPAIPHNIAVWPPITDVLDALRVTHDYFIVIIEDNIIAVPEYAREDLQRYCQLINTAQEQLRRQDSQRTRTQKGLAHLRMGVGFLRRGVWDSLRGQNKR